MSGIDQYIDSGWDDCGGYYDPYMNATYAAGGYDIYAPIPEEVLIANLERDIRVYTVGQISRLLVG